MGMRSRGFEMEPDKRSRLSHLRRVAMDAFMIGDFEAHGMACQEITKVVADHPLVALASPRGKGRDHRQQYLHEYYMRHRAKQG